jgi:hypothetical protein
MRPISLKYTPLATSTTGLASSVTGASWPLTTTVLSDGLAHIITITNLTANTHASIAIAIVGLDASGHAQSETISTGPAGNATVSSSKYYSTVTSVTPASTWGSDTASIGYTAVATSPVIPLEYRQDPFVVNLSVEVTGTISVTAQHSLDTPFNQYDNPPIPAAVANMVWFADATIAAKAANTQATLTTPYLATQLLINSVTTGGTVKYNVISSGEK